MYKAWRDSEIMVALLSMAGLLIAVAIYEIDTGGFAGKNFE